MTDDTALLMALVDSVDTSKDLVLPTVVVVSIDVSAPTPMPNSPPDTDAVNPTETEVSKLVELPRTWPYARANSLDRSTPSETDCDRVKLQVTTVPSAPTDP